ncbi:hypothetical protein M406DRAFT_69906 [Cryphonectria parasitica EP155]|uniref:Uncharacterized protein n=1 Tax=Cryphonectria parasitica (strain ATCC 38755 / EP155) TaxID=660469 RepID=A0A9P4Y6U4_CRYP1|nr:uncharacterized protein M406DRAFT_69906 [Cryphonectria parasitica EP155]KAF3767791.1 hypothetical protein M406DRAFT_69906 [Cryphonectria parasitica EP155]
MRIKQEEDEDMAPKLSQHGRGFANDSQQFEENRRSGEDQRDHNDEDEPPLAPLTDKTRDAMLRNEGLILSIEVDNAEEDQSPVDMPSLLHDNDDLRTLAPGANSEDGVEDEHLETDEDLDEELDIESEEDLLINAHDLRDYMKHKRTTPGIDNWPSDARRLYKLLYLRGLYPLMPSDWGAWGLRDHPVPYGLFMPVDSDGKALIRAEKSDYHATKALRGLFELHTRIRAYRQGGQHDKIAPLVSNEIGRYVCWAEKDANLFGTHDYTSPVFTVTFTNFHAASSGQIVVERCQSLIRSYRAKWIQRGTNHYPRLITIFVVIQHIVLIFTADTDQDNDEEPTPFAELDVSKKTHWLDSSLAIAISVMLARESLVAHREYFPKRKHVEADRDL